MVKRVGNGEDGRTNVQTPGELSLQAEGGEVKVASLQDLTPEEHAWRS